MRRVFLLIVLLGLGLNGVMSKSWADSRDIEMAVQDPERIRSIQIPPAKASINDEGVISIFFLKEINPVSLKVEDLFGGTYESMTRNVSVGELIEINVNMLDAGAYIFRIEESGVSWYGEFEIE